MKLSSLFQFTIGFIIGVSLLAGGAAGAAYLYFVRTTFTPPKPTFSEAEAVQQSPIVAPAPAKEEEETAAASDNENEAPTETVKEELPPGAYRARVTWPEGLSLRAEPTLEAERTGGIGYNWEILVLEVSSDNQWQKVRIPSSGQEGWVKAGNVEADREE